MMKNWENKRVALMSRVSTTEQKDQGYSLSQQKSLLLDFCIKRNIQVIEYFEEDYTGTTMDRPEYNKLKKLAKSKKIDLVLFHKWDRFARGTQKALGEIEDFKHLGIEINAIAEIIDFEVPQQFMMLLMYLGIGEVENKIRSKRTKDGIIGALREGRHVNKAPIGYLNGKDPLNTKKPLISPCPIKSELIRCIYEEYATGLHTQEALRKKYHKLGIKRGKSQFSNLLSNILYIGKIRVPEHNGNPAEIVKAIHKPIVTEATFYKVQKVKFGNSNIRINTKKTSKHEEQLPLRGGILKCARCDSNLTGSPSKSRNGDEHYYYHCNPKKGCKERFPIDIAHKELDKIFKALKPRKEVLELFKVILIDNYRSNQNERINNTKRLKLSKQNLEEKLDNLTEKYVSEDIDKNSYERLRIKYAEQMSNIVIEISELSDYNKDLDKYIDFGVQLLVSLNSFYEKGSTEIKRRIIGSIFSEKLVFDNQKYRTVKLNEAVALIFNNNKVLQSKDIKKGDSISKVSYSVAGTGLEPVTFGL